MKQIRTQVEETTSDYDREKLQERLAKLVGGVAVIKVGAATETEMKEKKARVEDAMHATKAAVEEGIVPGGGVALIRAGKALDEPEARGRSEGRRRHRPPGHRGAAALDRDQRGPGRLDRRAEGQGRQGRVRLQRRDRQVREPGAAGVIDPAKVVRTALQNAASIASLLLTTEALVSEIPEEKKESARRRHAGGGGMGGMYLIADWRSAIADWRIADWRFSIGGLLIGDSRLGRRGNPPAFFIPSAPLPDWSAPPRARDGRARSRSTRTGARRWRGASVRRRR